MKEQLNHRNPGKTFVVNRAFQADEINNFLSKFANYLSFETASELL